MLFIDSNNTKISSHGLINKPTVHLGTTQSITQNITTCYSIIAITYQYTKKHIQSTVSFRTIQNHSRDFATQSKFLEPNERPFQPRTSLTIKMALSQRINQVGENPYLPEFVETPQYLFSLFLFFPSKQVGSSWVKRIVLSLATCPFLIGSQDFLILLSIYHGFPSTHKASFVSYGPHLSSLFD